jgi:hypothetical protein
MSLFFACVFDVLLLQSLWRRLIVNFWRTTMRLYVYEGTPEEIRQVIPSLPQPAIQIATAPMLAEGLKPSLAAVQSATNDPGFVNLQVARLVLSRRKLSVEQSGVLISIYKAHPAKVLASELQTVCGYTRAQFAGLMGAFGRRISHTDGYIAESWFFDQDWNNTQNCWEYGLPETVREAMRLERLI